MNFFRAMLAMLLLASSVAMATPATDRSIDELLTVTEAKSLVDRMQGQIGGLMKGSVGQALKGRSPTAKEQKAIDHMLERTSALLKANLSWEKLEPMYVRLYKETFSEEEVKGMLAFYRTPSGQAVIHKMPLLMQKVMLETNTMIRSMSPEMQKIQQDFASEMGAAKQ
ncbi:MAG: DUF2059 domain-containing protein [Burkholderiales bacterium]|nr:DUF2059 domain-containing protein [Burkholderiales bacterium]